MGNEVTYLVVFVIPIPNYSAMSTMMRGVGKVVFCLFLAAPVGFVVL